MTSVYGDRPRPRRPSNLCYHAAVVPLPPGGPPSACRPPHLQAVPPTRVRRLSPRSSFPVIDSSSAPPSDFLCPRRSKPSCFDTRRVSMDRKWCGHSSCVRLVETACSSDNRGAHPRGRLETHHAAVPSASLQVVALSQFPLFYRVFQLFFIVSVALHAEAIT